MDYIKQNCDPNTDPNNKYMFTVDWYDPVAQLVKNYLMSFYPQDQTVELYDLKNHRIFLRRCKQEGISLENLYKSARIIVMSRQLKIVDYADARTKRKFEEDLSQTFVMIKPDILDKMGEIIMFLQDHGFKITKLKMGKMSYEAAAEFYKDQEGQPFCPGLLKFMSSGPAVAILVIGDDALKRWKDYLGPTNAEIAKLENPESLRAIYGTDMTRNGVHGSEDEKHCALETEVWFTNKKDPTGRSLYISPTSVLKDSTCCVIKPHAILEGKVGHIINTIIENGFKITAMEMLTLDTTSAEEFLEVYKGVVPEYSAMVVQFTAGPLIAIELVDPKNPSCSQETFRKLAGPSDPEIARKLRPTTLRALYGKTKVLNAVHCTDLADDALLEVEYFFQVLQI